MSLNWKEIDRILQELDLEGAFLQKIRQENYKNLILETYKPGRAQKILVELEHKTQRIHRLSRKVQATKRPSRFVELLRSRIGGYRIRSVSQWGSERIIRMEVAAGESSLILWIRLWGGASNIFLTDEKALILDAAFRRPKRGEVSGQTLVLPEKGAPKDCELRDLGSQGDYNSRLEEFFETGRDEETLENLRRRALINLQARLAHLGGRITGLEEQIDRASDHLRYQKMGDLILSNVHQIQAGDTLVDLEDWETGDRIEIPLDPRLNPQKNAGRWFKKAQKSRASLEILQQELSRAREDEQRLEKYLEDWDQHQKSLLQELIREAAPKAPVKKPSSLPGLEFRSGEFRILVGRNARENEGLLKSGVRGNDLWLHTRDYAGGYVFIKTRPGRSVPLETLLDAGNLAIHYSKAKGGGKTDLYYTEVKHLNKPKGAKKGLVVPTREKNLTVDYDLQRIKKIMEGAKEA